MKIAILMYDINNLGGIINFTEDLTMGFRELGHSVDLLKLFQKTPTRRDDEKTLLRREENPQWYRSDTGALIHQSYGWHFTADKKLSYETSEDVLRTKEILSSYDLLIWNIPVPTKKKDNKNTTNWMELYDLPKSTKQLAVVHDGNLIEQTPWIYAIRKFLTGLVCVHPCAYGTAKFVDLPRTLIFNPQNIRRGINPQLSYSERRKGFLSVQIFKKWKRVDDLVRAIPYLDSSVTERHVAGGGIEYAYMTTTEEKMRPEYYCTPKKDPDLPGFVPPTQTIWERALEHGMTFTKFPTASERDTILSGVRTLIDSSWSKGYSKHGDHFNRVVVDAMIQGVIPIARNLGIASNKEGEGLVFKPNKNYIMAPWDTTPKEYAEIISYANNLPTNVAEDIRDNNFKLLEKFDRVYVANQYIEFVNGSPAGFFHKTLQEDRGEFAESIQQEGKKILEEFFSFPEGAVDLSPMIYSDFSHSLS